MNSRRRTRLSVLLFAIVGVAAHLLCGCTGSRSQVPYSDEDRAKSALASSSDGLGFTDVTDESGLGRVQSPPALALSRTMSAGVAVADVDGDGFDDVLLTRAGLTDLLYLNQGDGTFEDVSRAAGISGPSSGFGSSAAVFFDADGDGALDLFRTGFGRRTNSLFMNDGSGRFDDQTIERGLFQQLPEGADFSQMHGASVADVNRDGHLDLLVLNWHTGAYSPEIDSHIAELNRERSEHDELLVSPCESRAIRDQLMEASGAVDLPSNSALYINRGDGTFSEKTAEFGLDFSSTLAFTGVFQDLDRDGWSDLLIAGDGCTSKIYRNIEGVRFEEVTGHSGTGTDENGMGSISRDLNGDGSPDWIVSSIAYGRSKSPCPVGGALFGCSGNRVYLSTSDFKFDDSTDSFGIRDGGWAWGLAAESFDNTGSLQIVMTNGYSTGMIPGSGSTPEEKYIGSFEDDKTRFWAPTGTSKRLEDQAGLVGISDRGLGRGLVAFDMENDGDLDILIAQAGAKPVLYRNNLSNRSNWLSVSLDDSFHPGNRWGDGARVEVRPESGSRPIVGWISTGGSYESQKPPRFHIGLGSSSGPLARVDIYWPGEPEPSSLLDVEPNQRLTISR